MMTIRLVSDESNIVPFPQSRPPRAAVEAVAALAPSRSLVDTLRAERGLDAHDVQAGFAREFAQQVRALEAAHGRDGAIARLRSLIDALLEHAHDVCLAFRNAAGRLIALEVQAAQHERMSPADRAKLETARTQLRGHVIAAGAVADAAMGATAALAIYIREGLGAPPVCAAEPRQLLLFEAAS
jgi:hypothetical protein